MPFHLSFQAIAAMVVFAGVSVVVGSFLAGAGGWRAAANRFPAPIDPPAGTQRFPFTSLQMTGGALGTSTYKNCVTVGVSTRGISLALWAPFRLFHPPLLIPWSAVEACEPRYTPWGNATRVTLRGGGGFQVYGRAGAALSSTSSNPWQAAQSG